METIRDLLAGLLDLNSSNFRVRYQGYPLRRLEDLDEEAWVSMINGLGAIRQRAIEAETQAIELLEQTRAAGRRRLGNGRLSFRTEE